MKSIRTERKNNKNRRKEPRTLNRLSSLLGACVLILLMVSAGCGNKFWDPAQVGRFRPTPAVNLILDSLGVAEETEIAWEHGEEPRPEDTIVTETDHVFRAGDVARISIFELLQEGVMTTNDYVVTETGKISIPYVGVIEAAGLTETQLEEEIRRILSPSILKDPSVTVTLIGSQQRTFSILGDGISLPGRYVIPRYDFRLTDALAMAGGQRQFNVSYIYVSRYVDEGELPALEQPATPIAPVGPEQTVPELEEPEKPTTSEVGEIIAPRAQRTRWPSSDVVIATSEMATAKEFGSATQALASSPEVTTDATTPAGTSMWQEQTENERVTVTDILNALAARSQRQQSPDATMVAGAPAEQAKTEIAEEPAPQIDRSNVVYDQATPATPVGDEESSVDSIMKTLAERSAAQPVQEQLAPDVGIQPSRPIEPAARPSEPPSGIDDILRSLEERPARQITDESEDWESVLKSFATPSAAEQPGRDQMDIDELLESFAEPEIGVETGEQTAVEDVDLGMGQGVEAPAADTSGAAGAPTRTATAEEPGRIEWVFQDGKWVPIQVGPVAPPKPVIEVEPGLQPSPPSVEVPTGIPEWVPGRKTRLIKIPADKLMAGDPRYNIVIRPGDAIFVPVDVIGEFLVMGNVNRQGYIPITGRPLTLKMAIAAAGGLGPLAYPKRCEVVRRIGRKKEEIVMVDLDKIASGEQPDFFIKPNDLINVGTHATSRWRAVLRNAFRATYGFGFVYDRNFALDNYYNYYGRSQRIDVSEAIKIF